jgi:hypothetical protein
MAASSVLRGSSRFQILGQLGKGGAGYIYEALDRERNARVALKTLRQPDAQAILLLKNEFRAIQDLNHPNIVTPKELFEQDGQWFFTMDLVRGVDFLSYVRPGGTEPGLPDEARLRAALGQLALGLSALHADHKVHRDIKPDNVLVAPNGLVQILDFGIVSDLEAQSHGGEDDEGLVGSVLYMAPEQALGSPATPAADWYAVGVMIYQALTGALPFVGSLTDVLSEKATQEPTPPAQVRPGVPSDLNDLCVALLHVEPADRPEGYEVLSRLGVTPSAESMTRARSGSFVGRRAELHAIEAAFAKTRAGEAVTVLVSGESGVGKSRLVREFTSGVAADTDALVFRGRCYERESLPYKAVDSVIDQMARYLATLPPDEVGPLLPDGVAALRVVFRAFEMIPALEGARITRFDVQDPQAARAQMFALLRALFVNLARHRPVVIAIDDLQWADADGLALINEILRPPDAPPLLLLASIRGTTERTRDLGVYQRLAQLPGDVRWLHLDPLPEGEARDLIRSLLTRADEAGDAGDIDAIFAEAKGHPLFIDELVRHRASHAGTAAPARLDDALWERAQELAPSARRLLEIVAVAGVPMRQDVIATAAALDQGQMFDAVGALRSANFVRTSGVYRHDTVEAYHDRVRESVLGHVDGPARKEWHGRLALALEQAPDTDPERLVSHWVGAGEDRRAAEAAVKAASAASAGLAFDHAASLYRLAIRLGAPNGDETLALKVKLAEALTNAARGADAAAVYLEAAGGGTSTHALDLRRRAAEQLLYSGRIAEGTATLESVLKAVGVRMPRSRIAIVLWLLYSMVWLALRKFRFTPRREADIDPRVILRLDCLSSAGQGLAMTDHVRGREFHTRTLVEALKVGEPTRVARATALYGVTLPSTGASAFEPTMKVQKVVESMARELGSPYIEAMAYGVAAFAYYLSGQAAKSREPFEHAEVILRDRCIGVSHELASARMLLYRSLVYLGDLPALSRVVDVTLRESEQRGDLYTVVNLRTNCTAVLALARDDAGAAQHELDAIAPHLPKHGLHVQHALYYLVQGWVWVYAGEAARARETLAGISKEIKRSMLLRIQTMRIAFHDLRARASIALLAAGSGDAAALRKEAEHFVRLVEREGLPWSAAHADALRGCLASLDGARDRASTRLDAAERGFDSLELALLAAATRRARGIVLGGEEGRTLVADAEATMDRIGVKNPARMMASLLPGIERAAPERV